jgi:predicted O-methyltransferase YrrM
VVESIDAGWQANGGVRKLMAIDWRELPAMRPFAEGTPMEAEDGSTRMPNSCSTPNNLAVLAHYFEAIKPQRTLEIGLAFGASATLMLAMHERVGSGEHHAVDPFQRRDWGGVALKHIEACGLAKRFTLHEEMSALALPKLVQNKAKFGLIYVDGSHLFEEVLIDFYFSNLLLELGGVIAFDDSACGHVAKVVSFIRRTHQGCYQEESPYAITEPRWPKLKQFAATLFDRQQLTVFKKAAEPKRDWDTPFINF